MNRRRLRKLADFLDALPRAKFNLSVIAAQEGKPMLEALAAGPKKCGTVACAIGWTPAVFPRLMRWTEPNEWNQMLSVRLNKPGRPTKDFAAAEKLFEISRDDALYLFDPYDGDAELTARATPKQVAERIRAFVERGGRPEPEPDPVYEYSLRNDDDEDDFDDIVFYDEDDDEDGCE